MNGTISKDPGFVDEVGGDFHLLPESPCIDNGVNDPFYKDIDNSRNDMGVYGGAEASQLTNIETSEKHD